MAIQGITFDNQQVSAEAHGAYQAHHSDGVLAGCAITPSASALTVSIAAGYMLVCGREIRFSATETVRFAQTSGFGRIRIRLDMGATASETQFNQASIVTDYAATVSAFPAITQQDVNNGGTIYDMVVGIYGLSSSGIVSTEYQIGESKAIAGVSDTAKKLETARNITIQDADGTNVGSAVSFDGSSAKALKLPSTIKADIDGTASNASACSGTAAKATTLATARKIGNASFNGSADITLAQIGAAASSHTHNASQITGASTTLNAFTARRIYITNASGKPADTVGENGDFYAIYKA